MHKWSTSPCYPDCSAEYNDLYQGNRDPLGDYLDAVQGDLEPRGGFSGLRQVSNDDNRAEFNFKCRELLFISPLCHGSGKDGKELGLVGVNKFMITMNYNSVRERILSINENRLPAGVSSANLDFTVNLAGTNIEKPAVIFRYLTPRPNAKIPKALNYTYYNINAYSTDIGTTAKPKSTLGAPDPVNFTSNSLQLSGYPESIFIWAREKRSDQNAFRTDNYGVIQNLRINFQNNDGLLSDKAVLEDNPDMMSALVHQELNGDSGFYGGKSSLLS
eukprot:TRINITY_DN6194_c0_g1_i11.p1 TRINITY_DN6194_c0_g1~~TRINITY_DN6194_c0_g1_i11.p1  ORF type:complete len:274 (+),score=9.52 TRINITY_DN6194_c0_g1_i11:144-965(+)